MKKEAIDKKVKNVETQTEDIITETNFTQTEAEVGSNTQTNADKINVETQTESNESKTEELIEVNEKGEIHPKPCQTILEFRISHDFNSWDEVREEIHENFKFRIIGNPWLANNGRHFKTLAFVTDSRSYENWKSKTLNSETGILRPVSFSKPYR